MLCSPASRNLFPSAFVRLVLSLPARSTKDNWLIVICSFSWREDYNASNISYNWFTVFFKYIQIKLSLMNTMFAQYKMYSRGEGYMFLGKSLLKAYDKYPHDITCPLSGLLHYTVSSTRTGILPFNHFISSTLHSA